MVNAKIKDLAPGTIFNAGPIDVRILEHFTNGRTLLIADTCIADRRFAGQPFKTRPEKPETNPNDWRFSNLRKELNTEFLAAFDQAEGPIRSAHILAADWDLADHEGGAGYGIIQDKIALLSEAMFRKYSEQDLLALDDWWWLITPYAADSSYALYVGADGSLDSGLTYCGYNGVRPAFYVESGITISNGVTVQECKLGDKIYQTDGVRIYESIIGEITLTAKHTIFVTENIVFDERAIGNSVFLSYAEAEAQSKVGR